MAFDLRFGREKLVAPGLALAFWTFVDNAAYAEAVIAGLPLAAGKFSALWTWIEPASLGVAMFLIKLVLADNAHEALQEG